MFSLVVTLNVDLVLQEVVLRNYENSSASTKARAIHEIWMTMFS